MAGLETAQVGWENIKSGIHRKCFSLFSGALDPTPGMEQKRPEAAEGARPLPLGLTLSPASHWSKSAHSSL